MVCPPPLVRAESSVQAVELDISYTAILVSATVTPCLRLWIVPHSVLDDSAFLGSCNFYGCFTCDLSKQTLKEARIDSS